MPRATDDRWIEETARRLSIETTWDYETARRQCIVAMFLAGEDRRDQIVQLAADAHTTVRALLDFLDDPRYDPSLVDDA